MRLWGSSSIHALRLAVCFAPEGEGDGEPLSYDQQIQADVAASVAEVEAKIPAAGQGDGAAERSDGLAARDASAADPAAQPTEAKADAQGRLRGPDGKFAPKSGDNQQRSPRLLRTLNSRLQQQHLWRSRPHLGPLVPRPNGTHCRRW